MISQCQERAIKPILNFLDILIRMWYRNVKKRQLSQYSTFYTILIRMWYRNVEKRQISQYSTFYIISIRMWYRNVKKKQFSQYSTLHNLYLQQFVYKARGFQYFTQLVSTTICIQGSRFSVFYTICIYNNMYTRATRLEVFSM